MELNAENFFATYAAAESASFAALGSLFADLEYDPAVSDVPKEKVDQVVGGITLTVAVILAGLKASLKGTDLWDKVLTSIPGLIDRLEELVAPQSNAILDPKEDSNG
jgi:hypothetical protein